MENYILCCDWGTSSFRLRLVDSLSGQIVDEVTSSAGIAQTFKAWEAQAGKVDRYDFYIDVLKGPIQYLNDRSLNALDGVPIVLSGMASSSMGIEILPYADLPFEADGRSVLTRIVDQTEKFPHQLILVSGVKSKEDVMRGEEIQFLGLVNSSAFGGPKEGEFMLVLPGTHSKHIHVKEGKMIDFKTFMTGELFAILSEHSILKDSIFKGDAAFSRPDNKASFMKGVQLSSTSSLLQSLFTVRTQQLFDSLTKEQNYFYLSGLLLGAELKTLADTRMPLVMASGHHLRAPYQVAVEALSCFKEVCFIPPEIVDRATVMGQVQVFKHLNRKE